MNCGGCPIGLLSSLKVWHRYWHSKASHVWFFKELGASVEQVRIFLQLNACPGYKRISYREDGWPFQCLVIIQKMGNVGMIILLAEYCFSLTICMAGQGSKYTIVQMMELKSFSYLKLIWCLSRLYAKLFIVHQMIHLTTSTRIKMRFQRTSLEAGILYHFNQFVHHASQTLQFWWNFPARNASQWPMGESISWIDQKINQKQAKIWYFGGLSRWFPPLAETKISANTSCVTPMGELIEMVQYARDIW